MYTRASPTAQTIILLVSVTVLGWFGPLVFGVSPSWLVLSEPVLARPWTLVTAIYAHATPAHLLTNAFVLAVVGFVLERSTTPGRFHAFFLGTGALSGVVQVLVSDPSVAVLGASGAVLALVGYVAVANPVSGVLSGWIDLGRRARLALYLGLAALVTLATAGPGVALVSHFTGFALGLVGGRARVLRPENAILK